MYQGPDQKTLLHADRTLFEQIQSLVFRFDWIYKGRSQTSVFRQFDTLAIQEIT